MLDGFEWLSLPVVSGGVVDLSDPDAAALLEESEAVAWIESGAPPVEGSPEVAPPAMPRRPLPVEVPAVALAVDQ